MEAIKNSLTNICNDIIITLDKYAPVLRENKSSQHIKKEHYIFLCSLLRSVEDLDLIYSEISDLVCKADIENDLCGKDDLAVLLSICMEYRKVIEKYISDTDAVMRSEENISISELKIHMETLTRKTVILKNSLEII